jgi:hypothetical protein
MDSMTMWTVECDASEQDDVRIVEDHLDRLIGYADDFSSALSLFNFCALFHRQFTGEWSFVAARDGAMTIYHIGKTMELCRSALKRTPTISELADDEAIAAAGKSYRQAFPTFEKMRHAIAHSSELFRDVKNSKKNTFSGSLDDDFFSIEGPTHVAIRNSLIGRKYTNTIDGKVVSYEICE